MGIVTIFISYSHDSPVHRERVLSLSERLRADGFETVLDQYVNGSPAEGWPRWMLNGLNKADVVLSVCTETYARRFLGQESPNVGKGVDWEGALITQLLYEQRSVSNQFIPVVFTAGDERYIPLPLRSRTFYAVDTEQGYQQLYACLSETAGLASGEVLAPEAKPSAPVSAACKIWQEKLEFLLVEDAVAVDPAMKFRIKHLINEAEETLKSLGCG